MVSRRDALKMITGGMSLGLAGVAANHATRPGVLTEFVDAPSLQTGPDTWPAPRHDNQNSNRNPHAAISSTPPRLAWETTVPGATSLTVAPETVVVGRKTVPQTVTALARSGGTTEWTVTSEPAESAETVPEPTTWRSASSEPSPSTTSEQNRGNPSVPWVSLAGDAAFVNFVEGIVRVDRQRGERTARIGGRPSLAPPVLANDRLYRFGNRLTCFDGAGTLQWTQILSVPAIRYAVGAGHDSLVAGHPYSIPLTAYRQTADPWQSVLDRSREIPRETAVRWENHFLPNRGPLLDEARVYAVGQVPSDTSGSVVRAVDPSDGDRVWQQSLGATHENEANAAVFSDHLLVTDGVRVVTSVDTVSGEIRRTARLDDRSGEGYVRAFVGGESSALLGWSDGSLERIPVAGSGQWRLETPPVDSLALTENHAYAIHSPAERETVVRRYDLA